jgi:hypothetical protein
MNSESQAAKANTRQSKRTSWSRHINSWQKSGLTQVQYCLKHQLNKNTFACWKSRLAKQSPLTSLVPVTIRSDIRQDSSSLHSGLVLSFNDRFSIELENGFNSDTLLKLIHLLENRSCSSII